MKSNAELPQVHTAGHLPSRILHPHMREVIEDSNTNNNAENKGAPNYESVNEGIPNLTCGEEASPNYDSGDETCPKYESEDEKGSIFDSEDEKVPIFDSEDESEDFFVFEDKATRIAFIQKVLAVKLLQVLGMSAIIAIIILNSRGWGIRTTLLNSTNAIHLIVLTIFGFIVNNVVTFGLLYGRNNEKTRRKNAFRYMFLVVYPLRLSGLMIICTMYLDFGTVLNSVLLIFIYYCVVVTVLLFYSIFSYQTKMEFSTKYGIIVAIGTHVISCAATIPAIVLINDYYWRINYVFISFAAVLMVLEYIYIVYIIEAMTSKSYWRYTPVDCLDGAINLQMDYYYLFHKYIVSKVYNKSKGFVKSINENQEV